ncbi:hypothetical protein C5Y96_02070 [Blastopirellula marina]|uniref:Uncharacterized protein n=1 Tax=Blastopirellula marina TaxID=124 RepID=A0A2S8G351_9BACT|nr:MULTISPECIES: hypothetical protein [Pirellulaceae]PQO38691.1 hypothetical protein C5Y96_02070 [Blastopirellula marina]RCS54999.1 hypothetical protein DTL36_02075 [Bremerella cremea]
MSEDPKVRKNRSPNHPSLPLETAVEKTKLLFEKYHRQPAPLMNACTTIGYKTIYSTSNQAIAALKSYGLVDTTGKGDNRRVVVTEVGQRIAKDAPDRDQLLKEAALAPPIHKEVVEFYNGELPHDDILRDYLLWERPEGARFNEDAVDGFISRLRDTMKYAKCGKHDKNNNENEDGATPPAPDNGINLDDSPTEIKVGSIVQWTSQGVHQFPHPLPIVRIDEHNGERFAYFEGKGHAPMSQLSLSTETTAKPPVELNLLTPSSQIPPPQQTEFKGPVVRFPLAGGTNEVEIRLKKPVSKKDFDRITQLLALSEDSLVADETDAPAP